MSDEPTYRPTGSRYDFTYLFPVQVSWTRNTSAAFLKDIFYGPVLGSGLEATVS